MKEFPQITLEQFVGRRCGVIVTEPIDWIVANPPGRKSVRIGLVGQHAGAVVKLLRWFSADIQIHILKKVAELRKCADSNPVGEKFSSIPDPRLIRGYLNGERYRKRPTVTQVPAGVPEGKQHERKRLYVPGRD